MRMLRAAMMAVVVAFAAAACNRPASCDVKNRANFNFTLKDMNGREISLAAYRGRPVVLNFWATWCGPCKDEIPALVELSQKYAHRQSPLGFLGFARPAV